MTQSFFAIAETWIAQVLSADSTITGIVTGGIWSEVAREGVQAPYIVMVNKSGKNLMVESQDTVWAALHYDVTLVAPGDDIISVDPATVRISQLLHKGDGATSGGRVIACTLLGEDMTPTLEAGVEYRNLTQSFELLVQQN